MIEIDTNRIEIVTNKDNSNMIEIVSNNDRY